MFTRKPLSSSRPLRVGRGSLFERSRRRLKVRLAENKPKEDLHNSTLSRSQAHARSSSSVVKGTPTAKLTRPCDVRPERGNFYLFEVPRGRSRKGSLESLDAGGFLREQSQSRRELFRTIDGQHQPAWNLYASKTRFSPACHHDTRPGGWDCPRIKESHRDDWRPFKVEGSSHQLLRELGLIRGRSKRHADSRSRNGNMPAWAARLRFPLAWNASRLSKRSLGHGIGLIAAGPCQLSPPSYVSCLNVSSELHPSRMKGVSASNEGQEGISKKVSIRQKFESQIVPTSKTSQTSRGAKTYRNDTSKVEDLPSPLHPMAGGEMGRDILEWVAAVCSWLAGSLTRLLGSPDAAVHLDLRDFYKPAVDTELDEYSYPLADWIENVDEEAQRTGDCASEDGDEYDGE